MQAQGVQLKIVWMENENGHVGLKLKEAFIVFASVLFK